MVDPFAGMLALAVGFLLMPAAPSLDPGPSPECPNDMRLVTGTHSEEVQHLCIAPWRDAKDIHCNAYLEGLTAEEGARTEVRVCMDQFEAPNRKGSRPLVMQSFNAGKRWCEKRNKRMCSEQEWELGCEGAERRPWVYGWRASKDLCNSAKGWRAFDAARLYSKDPEEVNREVERLWQGVASGTYLTCVSPFGVFDMMGNVEEWVATRPSRKWPGALMGGFWAKPWTGCRGTNDAHEPAFTFYETGFRCCADAGALDEKGRRRKSTEGN